MSVTLTVFPSFKGLWSIGGGVSRSGCSMIEVKVVAYGVGGAVNGVLMVNGSSFEISDGKCRVFTACLKEYGDNSVSYADVSGTVYLCADILSRADEWYFPSYSEGVTDRELAELLERAEHIAKSSRAIAAAAVTPISSVIGI